MLVCAILACTLSAPAWGTKGHVLINRLAAAGFSANMPAFLSSRASVDEIAFLGPQLDDLKGSGKAWDADEDPGHYVDVLDDGTIAGAVSLRRLPADREAYDTALRSAGTDQYKQGYLPYTILEGWQQVREDFAYWRVQNYAASHAARRADRLRAVRDRTFEESLIKRDIGMWGHYVGDASQPLHVTVHFNGWGRYPNPQGYTQARTTHAAFESTFVDERVTQAQVAALMRARSAYAPPTALISQTQMMGAISQYLAQTNATVPQLYAIEKSGGFASGSPQAVRFAASRLAAGAAELRDLSVLAWQDSLFAGVGYPTESVRDVLAGKAPWPSKP